MMRYGYNMMGGGFGMMIIAVTIIAIAIVMVFKLMGNNNTKDTGMRDNSLDILNEKLASGEINEDEYNHKKDLLLNNKK